MPKSVVDTGGAFVFSHYRDVEAGPTFPYPSEGLTELLITAVR